jgi:SynChlorMet cassette protein ScmD
MLAMLQEDAMPLTKPRLLLGEEFDDWAIPFDPDTGAGIGLNPVSVFIWKRLDGMHTVNDILNELVENCDDVSHDACQEVIDLVRELLARGNVRYDVYTEAFFRISCLERPGKQECAG